ncbi:FkbM family methyltransferase [Thermogladius sp. KZ2Tp1]|uniref:FkbM family methyltransferase n=1 Tax=Thermogladius sp. KZ2Tp1 TaxID=3136289 RepID=UPI003DAA194A
MRANTSDLFHVALEEDYELRTWFLPYAKGIVVDVGAYIGKYTVFACKKDEVERVVAIEPLLLNFLSLMANVRLNEYSDKVVLVNSAISRSKGYAEMCIPIGGVSQLGLETAHIIKQSTKCKPKYVVATNTLDDITEGLERIDFLKIDIEGHVMEALPGIVKTLSKTKYLFVELLGRDVKAVSAFMQLGFRLKDRHNSNFLFVKSS